MIKLANGHELKFLCASGALAFDGKGWPWEWPLRWFGLLRPEEFTIVVKSLTYQPRRGNLRWYAPWRCVQLLSGESAVNSVGLTNPGIHHWLINIYPKIPDKYKIIVSIFPFSSEELIEMIELLNPLESIVGVELNISCPNTEIGTPEFDENYVQLCELAKRICRHSLILKIRYDHDDRMIARVAEGFSAVHVMNAVPWDIVFPESKSPLEKHLAQKGAVSGLLIYELGLKKYRSLLPLLKTPMIFGAGLMDIEQVYEVCPNIFELVETGVGAVAFGTAFLRRPWLPNRIVGEIKKEQREQEA